MAGHEPLRDEEAQPALPSAASCEHTHGALQLEDALFANQRLPPRRFSVARAKAESAWSAVWMNYLCFLIPKVRHSFFFSIQIHFA